MLIVCLCLCLAFFVDVMIHKHVDHFTPKNFLNQHRFLKLSLLLVIIIQSVTFSHGFLSAVLLCIVVITINKHTDTNTKPTKTKPNENQTKT